MSMHNPLIDGDVPLPARRRPAQNGRAKTPSDTAPLMNPSFAHFRWPALALVLVLALASCASMPPPTAELGAAQQAVVRAEGADADQYASAEIATAREALLRAQSAMASGREDDARRLALAASADADLAYVLSRDAVAQAELAQRRAEVETLQRRLQGGVR